MRAFDAGFNLLKKYLVSKSIFLDNKLDVVETLYTCLTIVINAYIFAFEPYCLNKSLVNKM